MFNYFKRLFSYDFMELITSDKNKDIKLIKKSSSVGVERAFISTLYAYKKIAIVH